MYNNWIIKTPDHAQTNLRFYCISVGGELRLPHLSRMLFSAGVYSHAFPPRLPLMSLKRKPPVVNMRSLKKKGIGFGGFPPGLGP